MGNVIQEYESPINDRGKRNLYVVIYFLSLLSIIASPFLGKGFIVIAALLFAFSLFSLPCIYCYSLLYGLFPFANIFKLSPESISFLTVCEIMLLAKIALDMLLKRKPFKLSLLLMFGLTFTTLHIMVFSGQIDYLGIIKLIVRVLLAAYYLKTVILHDAGLRSLRVIGCSFSVSMLLMMVLSQSDRYMNAVSAYLRIVQYDTSGSLIRNGGLMDDPNYCSMAIMVCLSFLTVLYYHKLMKFEYWLLVTPLFLLGFTTYSKSYLLTAAAFLIILLLLVLFPKHKGWATLLCVLIAIAVVAIYSGKIEIINRIFMRFDSAGIFTGRDELNEVYLSYIMDNPKVLLLGEGFDATVLPGLKNTVHNLYIEMVFRLGLIGSALFVLSVKGCFPKKRSKSKLVNYIPAAVTAVMYMALAGVDSYALFYYIMLAGATVLQFQKEGYSGTTACV